MNTNNHIHVYNATFYAANYGSALQAYSLSQSIQECGGIPKLIKASTWGTEEKKNKIQVLLHGIKVYFFPEKHYGVLRKIRQFQERKLFSSKREKIEAFCRQNIDMMDISTSDYTPDRNGVYLVGSDQVWNIIDRDINSFYLLDFLNNTGIKKYSYAASIGIGELDHTQLEYYERVLSSFSTISVRENEAYELLSKTKLRTKLRVDIDPTLLHDMTFWHKHSAKPMVNKPYVFIYMLRPDKRLFSLAKKVANDHDLEIVYTGNYAFHSKGVNTITDAGIEEFLSLIEHAEYVITNSFHGTCFSLLFHKKFVSVKVQSTGGRAAGLLENVNLSTHLISDGSNIDMIYDEIDYGEIDKRLMILREKSLEYLKSLITE